MSVQEFKPFAGTQDAIECFLEDEVYELDDALCTIVRDAEFRARWDAFVRAPTR